MKTIYNKLLLLLLLLPFSVLAQSTISGKVLDTGSGQPLPGVNVLVQGTTNGTSTDFDGNFQLSNVKKGDKIVFSYVGYKDMVVDYNTQTSLNINLQEDANQLNEVVVQVGYGSVRRRDATGAVTTVTEKDFNKGPVVSVDQMVQGKVAGLQITNGGGSPGEGAVIRIRGGSSLNATNDPLYVVDGIPLPGNGTTGGRNILASINQNNIESITVLKDASATAIYGSRASNGVIIIVTKKGKSGELAVNYNGNFSVSKVNEFVGNLKNSQFREYVMANGSESQIALLGDSNTNWQKEIYRTAGGTDHNVAMSGGTENAVYRASVGFSALNGVLKRDKFERGTIGLALNTNFFDKHLKIDVNSNTSTIASNYSNRGAVGSAVSFDPTQPIYNEDGTFYQSTNNLATRNPLSLIKQFDNEGISYRSISNIQFDYKLHFFPDLRAVANFGYDEQNGRSYGGTSPEFAFAGAGNTYEFSTTTINKLMDLYLNYKKDISTIGTTLDLTGGYSYQDFRDNSSGLNYVAADDDFIPAVTFPERYNLQSFFARANISVADKYLLTLSYRADATSRFTEQYRWGYFPAAALAWKINEEAVFKNMSKLSTLKLRLGWGLTGQQDVGTRYPAIPLYLSSNQGAQYQFGSNFITTYRPQQYNPNLKWEETETQNIGLDFGFFNNRITGSVDVYKRYTEDLLLRVPLPPFFGFSNRDNFNIGNLENKGIELSGEVVPLQNDDWTVRIGGNVTFQDSKITKLQTTDDSGGGIDITGYSGGVGNTIQNLQVGYEPYMFYVFEQAYDENGRPVDGVYVDRNADGVVNSEDKYRYKKPAADVFYGFNTNVSYKNFDLSSAWRGSWGNYNYNNVDSNLGFETVVLLNETAGYLTNSVTNILETGFTNAQYSSDYYIQDASFLRLDNVTIGYTIKSKADPSTYRFTLSGQNLLIITDYKGIDPEIAGVGIDNNLYPRPIIVTLGLNVNF